MLAQWLAPQTVDGFVNTHLRRQPFARPGAAMSAVDWLDWKIVDQVLRSTPEPDVLVASRGRLVQAPTPRSAEGARELLRQSLGVVVRKAERHHPRLEDLARDFERDLPGLVHVQLYVTPAGTQTFGWHFDREDVFIVQTSGVKDYYMRANTVTPGHAGQVVPDFGAVRRETSPVLSARLIPGDWLYIPSGWWHLVHSVDEALSISIGVSLA